MSNLYVRSPHYQRHYQSMLLKLCSIYPYFETDGFDRAYIAELASVASQYPASGLDFCYYWTEKVFWDRFQLSSAYGEFPGRYGGPGYITQQQIGSIQMPLTPVSAQKVLGITPTSFQQTLETSSRAAEPAGLIPGQAPEVPGAYRTPASVPAQERVDLSAIPSAPHFEQASQEPGRNDIGDYLKQTRQFTRSTGYQRKSKIKCRIRSSNRKPFIPLSCSACFPWYAQPQFGVYCSTFRTEHII